MSVSKNLDKRLVLTCPTRTPNAAGFLWNKRMLVQVNCRGYVNSQFMQPEPSKYSHGPMIEATTFIQPEHSYFTHHAGRFFYLKDEQSQQIFSLPYEPMRIQLDSFSFEQGLSDISWQVEHMGLAITIKVTLTLNDTVEHWSLTVKNLTQRQRKISIYPYFSIGYMSWMNQSASFNDDLNAIVADSITPYQKVDDYFKNKELKDKTFLAANKVPVAWHANQKLFEGEGGLHHPDALQQPVLGNFDARYETPAAVLQYRESIESQETVDFKFLFGPAKDDNEIAKYANKYFTKSKVHVPHKDYQAYIAQGQGCLSLTSGDGAFDDFINQWLPRQMFYHGDVNRLSTDPQTRNYIQDNMGMCYINPAVTRKAFLFALAQQKSTGEMPDGILLHEAAQLKYINQVPHADHAVWLPICLQAYLSETADTSILAEQVAFADSCQRQTFAEHIQLALDFLLMTTDSRGLSYIKQGDWCDPMNMVGYQGRGVSTWLSLATVYALNTWCDICQQFDVAIAEQKLASYRAGAARITSAVNQILWQENWYARGITDQGRIFGTAKDDEGKIYLNPQSWAMLAGAASKTQQQLMIKHINKALMTPTGVMMLAPSYTKMVEDIGRITQKHPGVAENGSVYNHAAVFYIYALYQQGEHELAFSALKKMLPTMGNIDVTGQLPAYIPNYYRGAYHQLPEYAGRSSHLFNTGTIAWLYRCLVEELCGLKGDANGLVVTPKLPESLVKISGQRRFRQTTIDFIIEQSHRVNKIQLTLDGQAIQGNRLSHLIPEHSYQLRVTVPFVKQGKDNAKL